MNSLNSAAAQARIDDLLRTAGNARRARGARNRRVSSLFQPASRNSAQLESAS